jgi:hypothetical protein
MTLTSPISVLQLNTPPSKQNVGQKAAVLKTPVGSTNTRKVHESMLECDRNFRLPNVLKKIYRSNTLVKEDAGYILAQF